MAMNELNAGPLKKENLITLCPNRHSIKTYDNKDYLNRYLT